MKENNESVKISILEMIIGFNQSKQVKLILNDSQVTNKNARLSVKDNDFNLEFETSSSMTEYNFFKVGKEFEAVTMILEEVEYTLKKVFIYTEKKITNC